MSTSVSIARAAAPRRLGRYEVRAKIGDGGMATVYLGKVVEPSVPASGVVRQRLVALKVIKEEFCRHPEFVTMFLDEAKIISRLSHPNLVQVVELGTEGDRLFIAMELLLGQSLWDVWACCRQKGVRLRYDLAAWIGARVAEGLHHAHEMRDAEGHPQMLVHRDVNQSNVIVTYDGQVKVIDFGLAKAKGRAYKTAAGVVKGKIAYLSPEQVAGQGVDRRADVFALGTTLWELTTDRRLFRARDDAETLQRIYAAEIPDPRLLVDGYPDPLWQVLRRALAREPQARFATAADFARSLDEISRLEGREVGAPTLSEVMRELFADERTRDQQWVSEASAPDGPAPTNTMHPPALLTIPPPPDAHALPVVPHDVVPASTSWPKGAPPEGMFTTARSRSDAPLSRDETRGEVAVPKHESTRPAVKAARLRAALWAGLLLAAVFAGLVAAFASGR